MPMLALGLLGGAIFAVCACFAIGIHPPTVAEVQMSYADLAAVMLGAVAVLVTVLGVFIAILALWGYAQFKSTARSAAIEHIREEIRDGGQLRKILTERVDELLLNDASRRAAAKRQHDDDTEFTG